MRLLLDRTGPYIYVAARAVQQHAAVAADARTCSFVAHAHANKAAKGLGRGRRGGPHKIRSY